MTVRATLVAALIVAILRISSPAQAPSIAFVGVSVVPMDRERVLTGQTVVVTDGRIAAVGPSQTIKIDSGVRRIDGTGKFLMPGLVDMHGHLAATGAASDNDENERVVVLWLANGITTVRNMRGTPDILALRKRIEEGRLAGPRIFTTGPMNGTSQPNVRHVASVAEADAFVAADKAAGYDAIKVTDLPPEIYDAVLAAGRRHGLPVYGHVPQPVTFDEAIRGGITSVEHVIPFAVALASPPAGGTPGRGRLAPQNADWSRLPSLSTSLREAGVWVCPTLVAAEYLTSAEKRRRLDLPAMRYVPSRFRDTWASQVDVERPVPPPELLPFGLTLTKRLHDAGVGLLLGTDDLSPFVLPGFSLHDELALLVKAGLSPFDALRAGTSDAARALHKEKEFGTIAVGQRADVLLLDANPLENIANAAKRAGAMTAGRWFTDADLQERLRAIGDPSGNSRFNVRGQWLRPD
jgi:imidazolonepropionase-like amidohydrolase